MVTSLATKRCKPCEGGVAPLTPTRTREYLSKVKQHWDVADDGKSIRAKFDFRNYYQTLAFVNAVGWIAHQEDHHPDINFGYKSCIITYTTHAIGGLSENDFICAAKVDALQKSS